MARKLRVLLNIGTDDQKQYGIPNGPDSDEPPHEGDVISVEDDVAHVLVNVLKCAEDYDAKKEATRVEKNRAADEKRLEQHAVSTGTARVARTGQFDTLDPPAVKGK